MELLTIENAIEEYPLFLYSIGTTDGIDNMIKLSIFSFLLISIVGVGLGLWIMRKDLILGAIVMLIATPLLLFMPAMHLADLEQQGEEQQRDIITSALEKPEYQEKVESEFNKMGTSLDDVCNNEKNYPSLLCFKEKNGNVTWVGDKVNQPVTWKDDGVSYSMNLVSEYDEKTDQITVSLEWETTSNAGIMSNYDYRLLGALFVLFVLWNFWIVVTLKKIDNTDDNSMNAKRTARLFVINFLVLTGLWLWSLTTLIQ